MIGEKDIACPNCGKKHEFDEFEDAAEDFSNLYFEHIWKQGKSNMKNMSKKEVAEQMYFLGVKHFMEEVHKKFDEMATHIENEIKK
tara:strand:+ start:1926 stop:2183 length:258 start_codon:yes stop_codon:yes gene_type:complete